MILSCIIHYVLYRDCDAYAKKMHFKGTKEELDKKLEDMRNNDCYYIEVVPA